MHNIIRRDKWRNEDRRSRTAYRAYSRLLHDQVWHQPSFGPASGRNMRAYLPTDNFTGGRTKQALCVAKMELRRSLPRRRTSACCSRVPPARGAYSRPLLALSQLCYDSSSRLAFGGRTFSSTCAAQRLTNQLTNVSPPNMRDSRPRPTRSRPRFTFTPQLRHLLQGMWGGQFDNDN